MDIRRLSLRVALLVVAMSAPACRRKTGAGAEAGAGATADASLAARCLDLPGAYRRELHASADRETLYFLERGQPVEYKNSLGTAESRPSYDLMQVSTNGGTAKKIASDVNRFAVASTGEIVFTHPVKEGMEYERTNGLYVLGRSSSHPSAIEIPDGGARSFSDGVTSFAIDERGKQTLFVAAGLLYASPLAGGEPKKVGPADLVWGTAPDGSALVRSLFATQTIALDGSGKTTRIGSDGFSLRAIGDHLVFVPRGIGPMPLESMPVAGGTATPVPWSKAADGIVEADGPRIFARRIDGDRATLIAGDLVAASSILETEDASFDGAVELHASTTAVLVHWNTDGGVGFSSDDETDVCVLPAVPVALPSRHFAKKDAAAGVALGEAARGDLAGAKIRLRHGDYDVAVFDVPTDGPVDPETLRQRAKNLQTEVAKLTGLTTLGASIEFKNSVGALAYVHPGAPTKVLLSGGKKGHLQGVREQYDVELDPGALYTTGEYGRETGSFRCRGSVKNRGSTPLTVQIRCSVNNGLFQQRQESATTPETIAPGATGKYDLYAGAGKKTDSVTTSTLQNGTSIPYFNAYADRKSKEAK